MNFYKKIDGEYFCIAKNRKQQMHCAAGQTNQHDAVSAYFEDLIKMDQKNIRIGDDYMPELGAKYAEAQPEKRSQVTEQTDRLAGSLTKLHGKIGSLAGRLSLVLISSVPTDKTAESKTRQELVPLANMFEGFRDSVELATRKIEDLLDRLEL